MKIVFIRESEVKNLNPDVCKNKALGATESCFIDLAEKLGRKHDVKVLCPCLKRARYYAEYIPLETELINIIYINSFSPDIIIIVGSPNYLFSSFLTKFKKIFWQQNHPKELDRFERYNEKVSSKSCPFTVVLPSDESKIYAQDYYRNFNIKGIYNSIRDPFFEVSDVKKVKNKIVYVGSLAPAKGALELLKSINQVTNYNFNICGSFNMYGYSIPVYEKACSMYKRSHINYLGPLGPKELAVEVASAELCIVNPIVGNLETCCVSALEAMAVGTPVLAGAYSLIDPIIAHGGLSYRSNLGDTIINIMDDKETRYKSAQSGKDWTRKFTVENITAQWEKLLLEI